MEWSVLANIASAFQAVALVFIGIWAYGRFIQERRHVPHMEFSIDCNLYGPHHDNKYVAEFLISFRNKGFVRQRLKEILLSVHAIDENDPELKTWKECTTGYGKSYHDRLFCPIPLIKNIDVIPESYKPYLVEPNCEETVRYITPIPMNIKYILAHAEYWYPNAKKPEASGQHSKMPMFKYVMLIFKKQINRIWPYGYPPRPRTTERFIEVEARVVYDQYAFRTQADVTSIE